MRYIVKYVFLIILSFAVSILIYNHFEKLDSVDIEDETLVLKEKKDNDFSVSFNYTIDNPNVVLNPYGSSPLMALIIFRTKEVVSPIVTIEGKDGARDLVHTFSASKTHILPVYGLYPDYDNVLRIEVGEKTKKINIKTDKLPDDFIDDGMVNSDNSFYFTTASNDNYTVAYDENGEIRFYINGTYRWR